MYSRSLGIFNEQKASSGIESFNKSLREQYKRKSLPVAEVETEETGPNRIQSPDTEKSTIEKASELLSGIGKGIDFDTLIIIGIILILITQTDTPDLILVGALASVIF